MKDFKIKGTVSELMEVSQLLLALGNKGETPRSENRLSTAEYLYFENNCIDLGKLGSVFYDDDLSEITIEDFRRMVSKLKIGEKHFFVNNWSFKPDEIEEANLANAIAIVAEKNGLSINDMAHIYPLVLRMLKSKIQWAE